MGLNKRGPRDAARKGLPGGDQKGDAKVAVHSGDQEALPERLEAVRRWIAAGGHNRPEVAEAVARRILARGELRDERDAASARARGRRDSPIH